MGEFGRTLAALGVLAVAFLGLACGGGGGGDGESFSARAWGTPELIEFDDNGSARDPQIAMNGAGHAVVAWEQTFFTPVREVLAIRYTPGSGWGTGHFLETNPGGASEQQVAMSPAGDAVVVWQQSRGLQTDIWAIRYTAGDQFFGAAALVETDDRKSAFEPEVAMDAAGVAQVVWTQATVSDFLNVFSASDSADNVWGPTRFLETDNAGTAEVPQIAVEADGSAIAIWDQSDGAQQNIWTNRRDAGGNWGVARLIETNNLDPGLDPQIDIDTAGNALAVWEQGDGIQSNIWANRYTAGGDWGTAELIETNNGGDAIAPQVAFDAAGNALAVWMQKTGTFFDIWANRYTAGVGWGTAEVIGASLLGNHFSPQLAVEPAGNALVVSALFDGTLRNIWANRFTVGSGWGAGELIETNDRGDAFSPRVGIDAAGNGIAVWFQADGGRTDVWANRFE